MKAAWYWWFIAGYIVRMLIEAYRWLRWWLWP